MIAITNACSRRATRAADAGRWGAAKSGGIGNPGGKPANWRVPGFAGVNGWKPTRAESLWVPGNRAGFPRVAGIPTWALRPAVPEGTAAELRVTVKKGGGGDTTTPRRLRETR
jgi:hypothetical protein